MTFRSFDQLQEDMRLTIVKLTNGWR